jgi:ribosomal protein S27E
MGSQYIHRCNHCGYSVTTSGPWEFYRDAQGEIKPYGHPVPASEEAQERGIYGLSATLYCSECEKTYSLILVEFKKPFFRGDGSIWLDKHEAGECEPREEYKRGDAVKCPKCDNTKMILEPEEKREMPCPKCGKGLLEGFMELIS